jgi:hypothetical protein
MNMAVFWDVAPCSLIDTDRTFRGAYCLHQHHGATSQEIEIFSTRMLFSNIADYTVIIIIKLRTTVVQ